MNPFSKRKASSNKIEVAYLFTFHYSTATVIPWLCKLVTNTLHVPEGYKRLQEYKDGFKELCWVCGWRVHDQVFSSYNSRLRILRSRDNLGRWEVGSRWIIRDQANDASLGTDFITQEFLRQHQPKLDIPLIKEMRKLSAPTDKVRITLMLRAEGVGLDTIWKGLSSEQKLSYSRQLGNAIKQWRQFTSPVPKNVDGSPVTDFLIGECYSGLPTCKTVGRTTDEWFKNLEPDLRRGLSLYHRTRDPSIIEEKFQELRRNFPKAEPYVLTHGDLDLSNIIVKDDKIEAIIDWEYSAYLPWWVERWRPSTFGPSDFWDPIWEDIDGRRDEETFKTEVGRPVHRVRSAWEYSETEVEHPTRDTGFLRPKFCECQNWAGHVTWEQLGNRLEHKLKDIDWESEGQ